MSTDVNSASTTDDDLDRASEYEDAILLHVLSGGEGVFQSAHFGCPLDGSRNVRMAVVAEWILDSAAPDDRGNVEAFSDWLQTRIRTTSEQVERTCCAIGGERIADDSKIGADDAEWARLGLIRLVRKAEERGSSLLSPDDICRGTAVLRARLDRFTSAADCRPSSIGELMRNIAEAKESDEQRRQQEENDRQKSEAARRALERDCTPTPQWPAPRGQQLTDSAAEPASPRAQSAPTEPTEPIPTTAIPDSPVAQETAFTPQTDVVAGEPEQTPNPTPIAASSTPPPQSEPDEPHITEPKQSTKARSLSRAPASRPAQAVYKPTRYAKVDLSIDGDKACRVAIAILCDLPSAHLARLGEQKRFFVIKSHSTRGFARQFGMSQAYVRARLNELEAACRIYRPPRVLGSQFGELLIGVHGGIAFTPTLTPPVLWRMALAGHNTAVEGGKPRAVQLAMIKLQDALVRLKGHADYAECSEIYSRLAS